MRFFTLAALTSLAAAYAVESYDYDQDYEVSPSTFNQDFEPMTIGEEDFEEDEDAEYERVPDYQAALVNSIAKKVSGNTDYKKHYPESMRSDAAQANHNEAKAQARKAGLRGKDKQDHLEYAAFKHMTQTLQHTSDRREQAYKAVQQTGQQIQREYNTGNRQASVPIDVQMHHGFAQQSLAKSNAAGQVVTPENHRTILTNANAALAHSREAQSGIENDPYVRNQPGRFQDDDLEEDFEDEDFDDDE